MRTIEEKTNQDKTIFNNLIITKHFMERYSQRVSQSDIVLSAMDVLNDIKERMSKREKTVLGLFKKNRNIVKIPMGCFELVIKKSTLITIY